MSPGKKFKKLLENITTNTIKQKQLRTSNANGYNFLYRKSLDLNLLNSQELILHRVIFLSILWLEI